MAEERLALLTEVVPPPKTIHTLFNPDSSIASMELESVRCACINLGFKMVPHVAHSPDEVKKVLANLQTRPDHAIFRLSDPMFDPLTGLIGAIAHEQFIPYMGKSSDELERCGSLFALEPKGIGKQISDLVSSILAGKDPKTMPPVEPKYKELSINLQVAQNLGLVVSPAVVKQAHNIIPAKERKSLGSRLRTIIFPATFIISIIAVAASYLGVLPLFGITLLSTATLAILLRIYLDRNVIRPLNTLSLAAEKIGAGELNTPIADVKFEDEVSAMAHALRRMKSNLSNSYAELEELTHNLEVRVDELTETNQALRHAQHELEIAGKRIIEAEDNAKFALTTYIHDEILRPLDELSALAFDLDDPRIQKLADDLESSMRRLRFDLSVPILQDLGVELRRLIQETLPMIYPNALQVQMDLDLSALDQIPQIEPASVFLLYRFVHGAVSNAYRHSKADKIMVCAEFIDDKLSLCVMDDGQGFNMSNLDTFIRSGHYFFYDIQIRARQLKGEFTVKTHPMTGTVMKVTVPIKRGVKSTAREVNRYLGNKSPQLH
jgi:HAMP domain-containing protein